MLARITRRIGKDPEGGKRRAGVRQGNVAQV
jgi:hypothetical protein